MVLVEISFNAINPFFDPGPPGFPLMQSVGGLPEPGPFPSQMHGRIGQGQAFRFQTDEYPYVKPNPVSAVGTSRAVPGRRIQ